MSWIGNLDIHDPTDLYFRVLPPRRELRRFIRYYWILKCPLDAPRHDEFLAPDGFEEVIFSFGDGYRRRETLGEWSSEALVKGSYVVGCKTPGVTCSRLTSLNMIGVKLWPQSLYSILGTPLSEYESKAVSLHDLRVPALHELEHRLFEADSEQTIKNTLDRSFAEMSLSGRWSRLVDFSLNEIFAQRGNIAVDEIIERSGCHYRTVEKHFKEHLGLSPKTFAKIIRFKHVLHSLECSKEARWSRATGPLDFGYYDHSHFTKDFKFFTGTTPAKFLRTQPGLSIDVFRFCLNLDINDLEKDVDHGFLL